MIHITIHIIIYLNEDMYIRVYIFIFEYNFMHLTIMMLLNIRVCVGVLFQKDGPNTVMASMNAQKLNPNIQLAGFTALAHLGSQVRVGVSIYIY